MVDFGKIDIGNVRGIKGEKGDKGEKGSTPSYDDLKYDKKSPIKGEGLIHKYLLDADGNLCDENGYIIRDGVVTDEKGIPFNKLETGYDYKTVYYDDEGNLTNKNGDRLDENGNIIYSTSDFISDITAYIYDDEEAYDQLVDDIYPNVVNTLVSANPNDEKYHDFFSEIEGDIKYYICENDPKTNIYMENNVLHNTCKYRNDDGNLTIVPLEKNTLYFYNQSQLDDNYGMHYDIYVCKKYNTVPIKLVSASDFKIDYNVIDDLNITDTGVEGEKDVFLEILTRGTRGQFYSMNDVDTLLMNNLINKLGANNGIAQLNSNGKVPSSQLPAYIDDVVEGTMNNNATTFTPSNNDYIDSVKQTGKIYVDVNTRKTYRWTGSTYILISNPIIVDDGSTEAYSSAKGNALETKIGSSTLSTTDKTIIGAINELLQNKENIINKVQSLNNTSNHNQYPTAKCVYDALNNLDLSNLLSDYIQKSSTEGLVKNDGSIDTNTYVKTDDSRLTDRRNPLENIIPNTETVKYLNDYTSHGFYYCNSDVYAKYIDNCPLELSVNKAFFLLVETWSSNYIKQTITYTANKGTYIRVKNGSNGWSDWEKVVTNDNIIDDLTTGGTNNVLSAEQGKVLNNNVNNKANIQHTHSLIDINVVPINSAIDFNNLKTTAKYFVTHTNSTNYVSNAPHQGYGGLLIVEQLASNTCCQIFYEYHQSYPQIWYRLYNGSWKAWAKLNNPEMVNDLTTGGTDRVLTAEQGKILNNKINNLSDIVDTKENATNKITVLNSSSTDTQYPSAKCVYDELGNKANSNHNHDSSYASKSNYITMNVTFEDDTTKTYKLYGEEI